MYLPFKNGIKCHKINQLLLLIKYAQQVHAQHKYKSWHCLNCDIRHTELHPLLLLEASVTETQFEYMHPLSCKALNSTIEKQY